MVVNKKNIWGILKLNNIKYKKHNAGLTLVEVLIALVIGTITIATIYYSYGIFSIHFKSMHTKIQLNRDLRFALNSISRDIRNAGYQSTLPSVNGQIQSPFPTMPHKLVVRKNTYMNLNRIPGVYASGSNDVLEMIYDIDRSTRVRISYAQLNNGFLAKRVSRCITANCYNDNEYRYDETGYYDYNQLGLNLVGGFKVGLFDKNGNEISDVTQAVLVRVSVMMSGIDGAHYNTNVSRTFVLEDLSKTFNDKTFRDSISVVSHPRNLK